MKAADEFVSNTEVIKRIKDILSTKIGDKKVFDKDVAEFIGISWKTLASVKRREYPIFYRVILKMCARTGLDPMKLLF